MRKINIMAAALAIACTVSTAGCAAAPTVVSENDFYFYAKELTDSDYFVLSTEKDSGWKIADKSGNVISELKNLDCQYLYDVCDDMGIDKEEAKKNTGVVEISYIPFSSVYQNRLVVAPVGEVYISEEDENYNPDQLTAAKKAFIIDVNGNVIKDINNEDYDYILSTDMMEYGFLVVGKYYDDFTYTGYKIALADLDGNVISPFIEDFTNFRITDTSVATYRGDYIISYDCSYGKVYINMRTRKIRYANADYSFGNEYFLSDNQYRKFNEIGSSIDKIDADLVMMGIDGTLIKDGIIYDLDDKQIADVSMYTIEQYFGFGTNSESDYALLTLYNSSNIRYLAAVTRDGHFAFTPIKAMCLDSSIDTITEKQMCDGYFTVTNEDGYAQIYDERGNVVVSAEDTLWHFDYYDTDYLADEVTSICNGYAMLIYDVGDDIIYRIYNIEKHAFYLEDAGLDDYVVDSPNNNAEENGWTIIPGEEIQQETQERDDIDDVEGVDTNVSDTDTGDGKTDEVNETDTDSNETDDETNNETGKTDNTDNTDTDSVSDDEE